MKGRCIILVLTRKVGETVMIGDDICVKIVQRLGGEIRIGIEAPTSVKVLRGELYAADQRAKQNGKLERIRRDR